MPEPTLVILARAPEEGHAKTRLARGIGTRAALNVYEQLITRTADVANTWPGHVHVFTTGDADRFDATPLRAHARRPQGAGPFGERLRDALLEGCRHGAGAIAIGTDCVDLRQHHLLELAAAMHHCDTAIGPAADGGYWAFGSASEDAIQLLATPKLPWSSPQTLAATKALLRQANYSVHLGTPLHDIDNVEDLHAAVRAGLLRWPGI